MRLRSTSIGIGVLLLAVLAWSNHLRAAQRGGRSGDASVPDRTVVTGLVGTYCAGCHNGRVQAPDGRPLEAFDPSRIVDEPEVWARVYRHLQAGTMPPVGARRPDRATYDAALAEVERALDADTGRPSTGTDDGAIASRLASLLWNMAPDAALQDDARRNRLRDGATLEGHVRRLLSDERADAFVARFFVPWLWLDRLSQADPDLASFPDYVPSLRDALATETELFLLSQLRENRDPVEIWSAPYTFLNGQLARHYGVEGVNGSRFQRVAWSTPERAGLLGHGSVLMATSRHQHGTDAAYTSPATRARWVQEHFLGAALPRAFPGAEPVNPDLPIAPQTRTLPAQPCVVCHRNFFPLGYALESFDPIGRWRTSDQAGPVDTSGTFVDGTPTDGIVALRQVLLTRPEAFRTTITEALLAYAATGEVIRSGTPDTLVEARHILRGLGEPRWVPLIAAVARSGPSPAD